VALKQPVERPKEGRQGFFLPLDSGRLSTQALSTPGRNSTPGSMSRKDLLREAVISGIAGWKSFSVHSCDSACVGFNTVSVGLANFSD
jgi:hypothetical protein